MRRTARNRAQSEERRRKARLSKVEYRVAELETELAAVSEKLVVPPDDSAAVQRLGDDYVEIQNELEALIIEWEQLQS